MLRMLLVFVATAATIAAVCRTREPGRSLPASVEGIAPKYVQSPPLEVAADEGLSDTLGVMLVRRFEKPATSSAVVDDYLLYLPQGLERSDRRWPVILYLHGRSLRGDDLSRLFRYGLPRYLVEGRMTLPFIVVAPQLPDGQSWTDVDRLAEILEDVLARYPADRDRVYLTGYSMGGGGVWRMLLEHARLFAAAAPMAALTPAPSEAWTRAVVRLPMRVFHGTADEAAPFPATETMVDHLDRAGAPIELVRYPGARHGDLTRVYAEAALYDWFLAHRRGGR
jgi:predicted peptidase